MSACSRCGVEFACGMTDAQGGAEPCWCTQLPAVMPLPGTAAGCYCPPCLKELVRQSKQAARAG